MIANEAGIAMGWSENCRCREHDSSESRELKKTAFKMVEMLEKEELCAWDACRVVDYMSAICKEALKYSTVKNALEMPPAVRQNFKNPPTVKKP